MSKMEEVIYREISGLNRHLPASRPTLAELMDSEKPSVRLRDGSEHFFKRSELEYLSSLLEEEGVRSLRLPIVIEISTLYRGYFRVRGRYEVKVIDRILGEGLEDRDEALYPRYLLPRIRRLLPTTTTYAFITE
ncbi:MAG: uncharacterized protein PWQ79_1302 [Thermococcaceae archaeon]|nr:uncharacterized protein [Thermococcaceae archaeon]MDK2914387.1 uncharacterized protein [Thermococcaceae archaeon]